MIKQLEYNELVVDDLKMSQKMFHKMTPKNQLKI